MMSVGDYERRIWAVVGTVAQDKKINLQWSTAAKAKLHKARIAQIQKELRLIKKEVNVTKRVISAAYTSEVVKVGKGFGAGFAAGLFGRKITGGANASTRDRIRREKLKAVAPYDGAAGMIDSINLQLDQIKLQLDSWVVANS